MAQQYWNIIDRAIKPQTNTPQDKGYPLNISCLFLHNNVPVPCKYSLEVPWWDTSGQYLHNMFLLRNNIATDKRGYPHNIFLISQWKHVVGTH